MNIFLILLLIIFTMGILRIIFKKSNGDMMETLSDIFFIDIFVDVISNIIDSLFD